MLAPPVLFSCAPTGQRKQIFSDHRPAHIALESAISFVEGAPHRNRSRSRSLLRQCAPADQTRSAYAPSPCGSLAYAAQTGSALSPRRDCSLPIRALPFARSLSAPKAESGATGCPVLPSLPNCAPLRVLPIPIAATPAPPPAPRLESGPAACDSSPACALDSSASGTSPRG